MKFLPNLLVIGWAVLVTGSLFLSYTMPPGADHVWERIEVFLTWQATSIVIALIALGFSIGRKDARGSQLWWYGWGPIIGNAAIAEFVGIAVLSAQFLSAQSTNI